MGGGKAEEGPAAVRMAPVNTTERLKALRRLMKEYEGGPLDAYIVPTDDAHGSEYVASVDRRRSFISGFDGSAGVAVVTADAAHLFTDGRYWLQAADQMDQNWTLEKATFKGLPVDFLTGMPEGSRVGVDPTLIGIAEAKGLRKALQPLKGTLVSTERNLVDIIWGKDQPARAADPILVHPLKYAGKSAKDKLSELREELKKRSCRAIVVSALDEIAWLFNIRGSDIECNPVSFAYAMVTQTEATLFAQTKAVSPELKTYLDEVSVKLEPYENAIARLKDFSQLLWADQKVFVPETASLAVAESIGLERIVLDLSLVDWAKAIKNEVELEGFRQCHIRDGAALCAYFAWLEEQLHSGAKVDELQGASKLAEYRSKVELFRGVSFESISSTGPNAAIIHYSPQPNDCSIIDPSKIYLCDSGGQYSDGTTDVTRTLHFGTPTDFEKQAFTLVLKGHIALDSAVFPKGTSGYQLDLLARAPLWKHGLDYRHGTGHGVGSFLNVHEGPQNIGFRVSSNRIPLMAGMCVSNEPGYYHDGHFGIRIESIVLVREAKLAHDFGDKGWLKMENVTMTSLVDTTLLSPDERNWLNSYHEEVLHKVKPLLEKSGDDRAVRWLERECRPL